MQLPLQLSSLPLFENSLLDWGIALAVMAALLAVLFAVRSVVRQYHKRLLLTEKTELAEIPVEILGRTTAVFFVVLSLFVGLQTLGKSPATQQFLNSVLIIVLFWQAGVWASAAALAWIERRRRRSATLEDRAVAGSLGVIGFVVRVLIWSIVGLLVLDNVGIDVTALVAGLGIGGIAVALAAQNILGDLFASLSITFDKPFIVGDFLIVDDYLGSVDHIGVKSTRLRSLSGEQIVLSNADLLKSRVRNYGRMIERRIVMAHNVTYDTPVDLLEEIPAMIRTIVEGTGGTRFDRSHFATHGAASLDFETVYYVLSPEYNRYMDIQQAINFAIHRQFAAKGIEFAYPTQRLYLSRVREPAPAEVPTSPQ
ncbi:MAG: mechanosensitive ion channel family protein [Pseudomonadota bacterium]